MAPCADIAVAVACPNRGDHSRLKSTSPAHGNNQEVGHDGTRTAVGSQWATSAIRHPQTNSR
eukprot:885951-Lingulodinium_polyedra.AAC.1